MFTQTFDFHTEDPTVFQNIMQKLADVSGYSELTTVPVVPMGHSALATYPWNFAAALPKKTLAVVSIHGDSPQTNLTGYGGDNVDWENRNIDGIPALFVMGEYEWWEDRIAPGFRYQQEHPKSVITWFADAGHGHFDYSQMLVSYISNYIKKVAAHRLSEKSNEMLTVIPESGWLMDRWRKDSLPLVTSAPYKQFKGDRRTASWVFDKAMAETTEAYYKKSRGKKYQYIGVIQGSDTLNPSDNHAEYKIKIEPQSGDLTFKIKPFFSDSLKLSGVVDHAITPLKLDLITGPALKVNDTTFKLHFDMEGFANIKRSNYIWLLAHNEGDENYKSAVQQMEIKFLLQNTTGKPQSIQFPGIENINKGTTIVALKAISSSRLDVQYYVKSGPAYVEGDAVHITKIPVKTKFPVKITVVCWQYGIKGVWQSAEPVERSFYIKK